MDKMNKTAYFIHASVRLLLVTIIVIILPVARTKIDLVNIRQQEVDKIVCLLYDNGYLPTRNVLDFMRAAYFKKIAIRKIVIKKETCHFSEINNFGARVAQERICFMASLWTYGQTTRPLVFMGFENNGVWELSLIGERPIL